MDNASGIRPKLVVFDIEGVIFDSQLLLRIAGARGLWPYLKLIWRCLCFDRGRLGLNELLLAAYGNLRGHRPDDLLKIYRNMRLARNAARAIQELRREGHTVVLLSAGVPDFLVADLVRRLDANGGEGVRLEVKDGRFTGHVGGPLAHPNGKVAEVERWLARTKLDWTDVVAVGDDANNLPLMKRAGLSIGYRATWAVRQKAKALVDDPNLMRVAYFVRHPPGAVAHTPAEERHPMPMRPWHKEVRRKLVHGSAALLPLAANLVGWITLWISLLALSGTFTISEYFRLNGLRFPLVNRITLLVLREGEQRRLALAPLTLVAGLLIAQQIFPARIAAAAILIAALADSVGALVGERWGRRRLPHNRAKTVEGSLAFFCAALICARASVPLGPAAAGAFTATLVESFRLKDFDNLLVPLAAGFTIQLFHAV